MKILITGGAGFIGTKLCRELIKAEHEIVTLDNFLPTVHKGTKPDIDNKVKMFYCADKERRMLRKYFIGSFFIVLLLMGCTQSTAAYPNPATETPPKQ